MKKLVGALAALAVVVVTAWALRDLGADLVWGEAAPWEIAKLPEASLGPPGAVLVSRDIEDRYLSLSLLGVNDEGRVRATFSSTLPWQRIADFYEEELTARGWARVDFGIASGLLCRGPLQFTFAVTQGTIATSLSAPRSPPSTYLRRGCFVDDHRPWRSVAVAIPVAAFALYLFRAWRAEGRSRAVTRGRTRIDEGPANWVAIFAWVPYALLLSGVGPELAVPAWLVYVGLGVSIVGVAVALLALRALGQQFDLEIAIHNDHELVRSGPFRYVRHPIYTGLALHFVGVCLATGNVVLIAGTIAVTFPALFARARAEETLLREHFGADYDAYAREVPMLVPWRMT